MKRRLIGLVTIVSAALLLAVVVLRVRSDQAGDDIGWVDVRAVGRGRRPALPALPK